MNCSDIAAWLFKCCLFKCCFPLSLVKNRRLFHGHLHLIVLYNELNKNRSIDIILFDIFTPGARQGAVMKFAIALMTP